MRAATTIRLFDAEPDLIRFLNPDEAELARDTRLPVHQLPKGELELRPLFEHAGAFAALVLDGLLQQSVRLGSHAGLRLLGPGDVLPLTHTPRSVVVTESACRALVPTRLVLLEREMLIAVRRWPQIAAGLHAHLAEQSDRLMTQLMICQLPRVDDRLLALMWLLAESWGLVTPAGTVLPLSLTHAALGGLIGARRPTVTLALGNLSANGLIRREPRGWLLLGSPTDLWRPRTRGAASRRTT
jgi:CRP-like cAMP-binding protein